MPPRATDKEIGKRLREARKMAGLSQGQAAKLLGFDRPTISTIEAGDRSVKAKELQMFSELYEVGYDWILGQWHECDLPQEMVLLVEKLPPVDRRKLLRVMASYGQMFGV